ncbi:hypothetical protein ULG90_06420 [Halopseudomonas pachastrellae]|nr:hypothetical protein UMZ34_24055 [Halopseudomonas pachastrellae]WVM93540.1 hypothetical protein ULG90_06420 [Halopseudomonas pachastrellae]|tara:strand:- start:115 stop:300 length:186 start_codon:yes stop_codon:yes gene_type:complete
MAKSENSAALQPELVEVVLAKDHTHKNAPCKAGDKINVTPAQRDWLVGKGVVSAAGEVTNG